MAGFAWARALTGKVEKPWVQRAIMTDAPFAQLPIAPDLATALTDWHAWLKGARRAAANTERAYTKDISDFLTFLANIWAHRQTSRNSGPPCPRLSCLAGTARRQGCVCCEPGAGTWLQSVGCFRYFARQGYVEETAVTAVRAPRQPRRQPRPISEAAARDVLQMAAEPAREGAAPWVSLRDHALFLLLYAAGLRIGEALALTRGTGPCWRDH